MLDVGTSVRYYPTNHGNGNVSESINSNGSGTAMLAAHFEYDPFGNLTAGTSGTATAFPYRFSTKPQDPVTGLLYYGYRWYDPLTGRWPSRDPIEEEGGVNLYGFVGNDSTGVIDFLRMLTTIAFISQIEMERYVPGEEMKVFPGGPTNANPPDSLGTMRFRYDVDVVFHCRDYMPGKTVMKWYTVKDIKRRSIRYPRRRQLYQATLTKSTTITIGASGGR